MSQPNTITAAFLDRVISLLAPLFLAATGGDISAARQAADSTLASYHASTDDELRLVALTIAFGFGALDALGQAASPDLSLNQILRLRSNATALSRAGHQHQAVLDKRRKQASAEPKPEPEPAQPQSPPLTLPSSADTSDLVAFARSVTRTRPSAAIPTAPLSRQQRRAAERESEKVQRRQEHESRREARAAELAARRQSGLDHADATVDQPQPPAAVL